MSLIPNREKVVVVPVTISSGAALSSSVNLGGRTLVGIMMPTAWTAANLTFKASIDRGSNFYDCYDDAATEIIVQAAASRYLAVPPTDFLGMMYIQVRSGTTGTPVNQGADRELNLVLHENTGQS